MPMPARLKVGCLSLGLTWGLVTALGQAVDATVKPSEIMRESRGTYRGAPVVHATFVEDGPKIDGDLGDDVWQKALPAGEMFQIFPGDKVPASEATEFRVLYDESNLYIAIWSFHKNLEEITDNAGNEADAFEDDWVGVVLDTFHDKRNSYAFLVTPNSLRVEMLSSDNGRNQNLNWETVWTARCGIHDWGWAAELAIPFKSISFDEKATKWGINLARSIKSTNESISWANGRPGADAANAAEAGVLLGLKDLEQGLGLDAMPFLTSKYSKDRMKNADDFDFDGGIDLRYRFSPSITTQLSVNTDFADVEADHRQYNFTRFNESFPEKRGFFLEDAGIFDFTAADGVSPYYSRKIGLSASGEVVPIHLAAKVTGRTKGYNFGLMDVLVEGDDHPRNVFVGRVRKNMANGSTVGLISTLGDPRSDATSFSLGTDYQRQNNKFLGKNNLLTKAWVLGSYSGGDNHPGMEGAYGASAAFWNRDFLLFGGYSEMEDNFNPALGYVWRNDFRKYNTHFSYNPNYDNTDWLQTSIHEYGFEIYTDTGNNLIDTKQRFQPVSLVFASGDTIAIKSNHHTDRPSQSFTIFGATLPSRKYEWWNHTLSFDSSSKRKISGGVALNRGALYESPGTRYEGSLNFRLWKKFLFGVDYAVTTIDWETAPQTKLKVATGKATINFSPDLFISNLIQYDNDSDSVGVNSRLQWEYKPGAKFFFVVNQSHLLEGSRFSLQGYGSAIKLGTLFRF